MAVKGKYERREKDYGRKFVPNALILHLKGLDRELQQMKTGKTRILKH